MVELLAFDQFFAHLGRPQGSRDRPNFNLIPGSVSSLTSDVVALTLSL